MNDKWGIRTVVLFLKVQLQLIGFGWFQPLKYVYIGPFLAIIRSFLWDSVMPLSCNLKALQHLIRRI